MVTALASATQSAAVKYQAVEGPGAQSSRGVLLRFGRKHRARAAASATPCTSARTKIFGPASASVRKYRLEAIPIPTPVEIESKRAVCNDHRNGAGNNQRSSPKPINHASAR